MKINEIENRKTERKKSTQKQKQIFFFKKANNIHPPLVILIRRKKDKNYQYEEWLKDDVTDSMVIERIIKGNMNNFLSTN